VLEQGSSGFGEFGCRPSPKNDRRSRVIATAKAMKGPRADGIFLDGHVGRGKVSEISDASEISEFCLLNLGASVPR
jgi:hypothetical protein